MLRIPPRLTCPPASLSQHREDLQPAVVDSVPATRTAGTTEPDFATLTQPFPTSDTRGEGGSPAWTGNLLPLELQT